MNDTMNDQTDAHVTAPGVAEADRSDLPEPPEINPAFDPRLRKPIRLVRERINRNGPCFCGSGLKFKKCCIRVGGDAPTVR